MKRRFIPKAFSRSGLIHKSAVPLHTERPKKVNKNRMPQNQKSSPVITLLGRLGLIACQKSGTPGDLPMLRETTFNSFHDSLWRGFAVEEEQLRLTSTKRWHVWWNELFNFVGFCYHKQPNQEVQKHPNETCIVSNDHMLHCMLPAPPSEDVLEPQADLTSASGSNLQGCM